MINKARQYLRFVSFGVLSSASAALAQDPSTPADVCDAQCEATRSAQDPTAEVNGIFLNNTSSFGSTSEESLYNFELQGVRTLISRDWGSLVLRGIVPIVGAPVAQQVPNDLDTEFGISDSVLQLFYIPRSQIGIFNYGFGPQVSLSTHTDDPQQRAGWGAGLVGGAFGFAGQWSFGGLVNHLWGEDSYSTTTLQPIVYYNVTSPNIGDWFVGYNAQITYDWSADRSDDAWTVPLGLTFGKTFLQPSGTAVTYNLGAYSLLDSPGNAFDWQLRFAVNVISQ